jgi:hypothetical protein
MTKDDFSKGETTKDEMTYSSTPCLYLRYD